MRWGRWIHKWLGILSCLFILLVSLTALALNHTQELQAMYKTNGVVERHFALPQAKVSTVNPFNSSHWVASPGNGIFSSHDQGKTWQEIELYMPAEKVVSLAFAPDTENHLWLGLKEGGVFFSDDGGEIWEAIEDLPFDPVAGETLSDLYIQNKNQIVIKTLTHIYNKTSNGWSKLPLVNIQKTDFFQMKYLIYQLHTGDFFGPWGRTLYDTVALSLILLSLSGLYLAYRPGVLKRKSKKNRLQINGAIKTNNEKTPTKIA